jgi:hypothetical protein
MSNSKRLVFFFAFMILYYSEAGLQSLSAIPSSKRLVLKGCYHSPKFSRVKPEDIVLSNMLDQVILKIQAASNK